MNEILGYIFYQICLAFGVAVRIILLKPLAFSSIPFTFRQKSLAECHDSTIIIIFILKTIKVCIFFSLNPTNLFVNKTASLQIFYSGMHRQLRVMSLSNCAQLIFLVINIFIWAIWQQLFNRLTSWSTISSVILWSTFYLSSNEIHPAFYCIVKTSHHRSAYYARRRRGVCSDNRAALTPL